MWSVSSLLFGFLLTVTISRCRRLSGLGTPGSTSGINAASAHLPSTALFVTRRWLSEDVNRVITVVDPHWPGAFRSVTEDFRAELDHFLERTLRNDQRLNVIREPCSSAITQLLASSQD